MKAFLVSLLFSQLVACYSFAAADVIDYFSCKVEEPVRKGKTVTVTVKFAVKNLDMYKGKGELIQYPGSDDEMGAISVEPQEIRKDTYAKMTNLNGQGGDLRLEGDNIRLWGDGDGYVFTDLVIWDVDYNADNEGPLEGYVRDYGSAYGDTETFKQFIKCERSLKRL